MKIIVIWNYARGLLLFRLPLIREFVELGHSVIAYAPEDDSETRGALEAAGASFRGLPLDRTGTNVFRDILFVLRCWRVMSREKPDILLFYTIKPVILGSLAARIAGIGRCYSVITGLGYVFIGDSAGKHLLRLLVSRMYKWSLKRNRVVFLLNKGSAMFVMGNSFESGLNRDCNDTRKTISAAFGAGRSVASEVRGLRGAGEQGCDSHRGEAATVGQPKVPAL